MRNHLTVLICLLMGAMASTAAVAERRVALVVGNADYANTQALKNPLNDAEDLAAALKQLGFDVVLATDVDQAAFARQIDNFARRLEGADIGLFYYAGHGLQVNEKNSFARSCTGGAAASRVTPGSKGAMFWATAAGLSRWKISLFVHLAPPWQEAQLAAKTAAPAARLLGCG